MDNSLSGMGYMMAVRAALRRPLSALARERVVEGLSEGGRRESLGTTASEASTWSQNVSTRAIGWTGRSCQRGSLSGPMRSAARAASGRAHSTSIQTPPWPTSLPRHYRGRRGKRGACGVELARTAAKARVVASLELIWRDERRRQCATDVPLEPTMRGGQHYVLCKCCFKFYVTC